ncbi:SfnB family sulfur acquisition oxidoreductase [Geminicoccus flavidas]|uniref:SfnB family sulfur acquisition oxidoreductase n=1 Tax=Geminicoccus flavidas TaxID=2506407 RepID=UPI00190F7C45|nr:SfnB family sulfur acquisition oxidoreductase [Geminicoccus flavidas]
MTNPTLPELPVRRSPARRIGSDVEALVAAREVVMRIAEGSAKRDRERILPVAEIEAYSQSGLWGILVPKAFGGPGVSAVTLAEVTAIVSAADASIGQIPQNHHYMVEAIVQSGTPAQQRFFFGRVLEGDRLGNAFAEIGTKRANDYLTRLTPQPDGSLRLDGRKFYATGTLFAHWIVAVAKGHQGRTTLAFVPRGTPGLTLIDDWNGFGQRTTGSGTVLFESIGVPPERVIDHQDAFDRPSPMGPVAQIIHAAIDQGIARAALADTIAFVQEQARPWMDSGQDHAHEDVYTIHQVGELKLKVDAGDALLERAGELIDRARAEPDEGSVARASVAVAEAKVWTTETSLLVASKLFELGGSRATTDRFAFDRHWRNARTHTLHDPVRWKYHHIGNFHLNGVLPPRHGAL